MASDTGEFRDRSIRLTQFRLEIVETINLLAQRASESVTISDRYFYSTLNSQPSDFVENIILKSDARNCSDRSRR